MNDQQIVEIIRLQPRTTMYFSELLGCSTKSASNLLNHIRARTGVLKLNSQKPAKWVYDGDFICEQCKKSAPHVRRRQQMKICTSCWNQKQGTRFANKNYEINTDTWAEDMADCYLCKKLTDNPPEMPTFRCRR